MFSFLHRNRLFGAVNNDQLSAKKGKALLKANPSCQPRRPMHSFVHQAEKDTADEKRNFRYFVCFL